LVEENKKLISETEVARTTGFFHVSFEKQAKGDSSILYDS